MTKKRINLGEYVITIIHDSETGQLDVEVFDEGGELIESINIANDEEDEEDEIGFNLN